MFVSLLCVFVCKEDSNTTWKHESIAPLVQRFLKSYRKKHNIQFVTSFGKKSLKNIIQLSMTVLKKFSVHVHFFFCCIVTNQWLPSSSSSWNHILGRAFSCLPSVYLRCTPSVNYMGFFCYCCLQC